MPVYTHRGRFDTRFLGVLIRAWSLAELESFRRMDWTESLPADQLVELPIDAFVSDVARLSVLDHEIRHFHDALLFPFGAAALQEQVTAATNGVAIGISLAEAGEANILPVPLQEWLSLPASRRTQFLEQQANYLSRRLVPPELPVLDPNDDLADLPRGVIELEGSEAVRAASRLASKAHRHLDALWRAPHPPGEPQVASTAVMWEVPGTLCQLGAIYRLRGEATMQRFTDWLLKHGPTSYRRGITLLNALSSDPPGTINVRERLALAVWSQMGRFETKLNTMGVYEIEAMESSCAWRLGQLLSARRRGLRWRGDTPFLNLIALWDETIGRSSLADLDDSSAELAKRVDRDASRAGFGHPSLRPLSIVATAMRAYYRAHLAMKEAFRREPDTFVDPLAYLDRRSIYPEPALAISYTEELEGGDTRQDWIDATPPDWRPAIDVEAALNFGSMAELANALFLPAAQTLEPGARRWIREYFHLDPLRLILIP